MKQAEKEARKAERLEQLREILQPGDTVYTNLRHVSRSGMMRVIQLTLIKDNEPRDITYLVAPLIEGYNERHGGAKISGCGMDMGFEMVYTLSRYLFPDGFGVLGYDKSIPQGLRPETKEDADFMRACKVEFRGRNGDESGWDNDGGYALKQRWL